MEGRIQFGQLGGIPGPFAAGNALSTAQTGVFLYIEPLVAAVVAFIILGMWLVNR